MLFILIILLVSLATAQDSWFSAGQQLAVSQQPAKPSNPNAVPGYQGSNPSQVGYYKGDMQAAATSKLYGSEVGEAFIDVNNQRQQFTLDHNDPIFKRADGVIADPLKVLETTEQPLKRHGKSITTKHYCQEAREEFTKRCRITRVIKVVQPPDAEKICVSRVYGGRGCFDVEDRVCGNVLTGNMAGLSGKYHMSSIKDCFKGKALAVAVSHVTPIPGCSSTSNWAHIRSDGLLTVGDNRLVEHEEDAGVLVMQNANVDVHIRVQYRPDPVAETTIKNDCAALEKLADQNLCFVESETTDGPGTRTSNGVSVERDWWVKQRKYRCEYLENPPKSCDALKARGCVQVASKCIKKIVDQCVLYQQTYECRDQMQSLAKSKLTGAVPYCLDGACVEQAWAPNQDMAEALSKLLIFKHMQTDMNAKAGTVFTGKAHRCHRDCVSFNNCCRKFKGWGQSIGLTRCSAAEKGLAMLRDKHRCVLVGTYCSKKVLGVCVRKKTSFCCFGTKLARIIHEQGRRQLGLGYGTPKEPECRGLTIDELTRIDFGKVDLSELFADIKLTAPPSKQITKQLKQSVIQHIKQEGQ